MYIPPKGKPQNQEAFSVEAVACNSLSHERAIGIVTTAIRCVELVDFFSEVYQGEIPWVPVVVLALSTKKCLNLVTKLLLRYG